MAPREQNDWNRTPPSADEHRDTLFLELNHHKIFTLSKLSNEEFLTSWRKAPINPSDELVIQRTGASLGETAL